MNADRVIPGLLAVLPLLTHTDRIVGQRGDPRPRQQVLLDFFAKGLRGWPGEPAGLDPEVDQLLGALPAWVSALNQHPDLFLTRSARGGLPNGGS